MALGPSSFLARLLPTLLLVSLSPVAVASAQQVGGGSHSARPAISGSIDAGSLVVLKGNIRADLTPDRDLGPVEDSHPLSLNLVLKRSPAQQADLDAFIARQQQPGAPEYHQWLTPQQFGERFGLAAADIHKIVLWLQSQ